MGKFKLSWLLQPQKLKERVVNFPALIFYRYLWTNNRTLLFSSVLVNYVLPLILEMLPWLFSRRKVGNQLRDDRNRIHHNMINNGGFLAGLVFKFIGLSALHAILETIDRQLRNRIATQNRLVIRKLVMERILFSELAALEKLQGKTSDLDSKITTDINQTLNLFNYTIPGLLGGCYALAREIQELYHEREHLDWLAVARPLLTLGISKAVNLFRYHAFEEREEKALKAASTGMSRLISNAVEGLAEIQINNLQPVQLDRLDSMIDEELTSSFGIGTTITRVCSSLGGQKSLFDFITEVWVVHMIMLRRGITHETYRKIQNDIDHVVRIGRRTGAYASMAVRILHKQSKIVDVLTLPNFLHEEKTLISELPSFECLCIKDVQFRYSPESPNALDISGEMRIEAGKTYALIGQNRSGKSTLTNILCKLFQPEEGEVYYNDIPYSNIARVALRDRISYVTQKPFIFPGTIRENILMGSPNASHDQVLEAARMAGVLVYASDPGSHRTASHAHASQLAEHLQMPPRPVIPEQLFGANLRVNAPPTMGTPLSQTAHLNMSVTADDTNFNWTGRLRSASITSMPMGSTGPSGGGPVEQDEGQSDLKRFSPRFRQFLAAKVGGHPVHPVLDYELTARGGNVSGGFAQSIALARIFLRTKSRVLILDEAMGMMDAFKKREVIMPNLTRFARRHNMTLIMITHDLPSIQNVDHIFVLEAGKLKAQGGHQQLLNQRSESYTRLLGND